MQAPNVSKPRTLRDSRFALSLILLIWLAGALFFASSPPDSGTRAVIAASLTWSAAPFTGLALVWISRNPTSSERAFWITLGSGIGFRFAGDAIWLVHNVSGFRIDTPLLEPQDFAYVISYALIFYAMLYLVSVTTLRLTFITSLDAMSIMLSVSVLVWYFILNPVAEQAGLTNAREILVASSQPICDVALLFLTLVVLSTSRRPPFTGLLSAGFAAFLIADGLYLWARTAGPYRIGSWSGVVWTLGTALLGAAVVKSAYSSRMVPEFEVIRPWRVFSFWFGPLSPACHFALLLAWGAFHPPLPSYVL